MSTPEDEWEEFINTVVANVRQHAGYFSWESDRSIEEVGVVQSLHESLEKLSEGFFHSYRSRGDGNDPPDCEALDTEGDRIGIEVTELVDGSSISATRRGGLTPWEPWKKVELYELIRRRIEIKDNPYERKGGPYHEYILIIYCDEPRVLHYDLIEYIRGCVFGPTKRLDRVFLLMSYSPWEQCCPFVELQLNI